MMALDTAGMLISSASGFATAQLFNPLLATQGSLIGAFMSVTGVLILFAANLHHLLITGLIESYQLFPLGAMPDTGDMAQMVAKTVAESFAIGIKIGAPFIVLTFVLYIGMGALSRLMPQMQIFMVALPLQIFISLVAIAMTLSATYLYWATQFDQDMTFFFSNAHSG
jgi:flagellar biosynthetic protein FliR